ncbi:MAG: hypothetical protein AB7H80_16065 [Candidatus Kapaibacterium sp.]
MQSRWFEHPFCEVFPIAHLMRGAFPEYWLRIHSLPNSKRYPDDEAERQIVFDRHSQFGTALLGEHVRCLVIQSCFNGFSRSAELLPELEWRPIHQVVESDGEAWNSWMAYTTWDVAAFRTLLLAIADEREAHIAFVSEVTDCVFIPYDGGADGFSFDTELLRRLSEEFAPWRSAHPLGL